jgi:hypothetical protein
MKVLWLASNPAERKSRRLRLQTEISADIEVRSGHPFHAPDGMVICPPRTVSDHGLRLTLDPEECFRVFYLGTRKQILDLHPQQAEREFRGSSAWADPKH